jgi:hypothetical protein
LFVENIVCGKYWVRENYERGGNNHVFATWGETQYQQAKPVVFMWGETHRFIPVGLLLFLRVQMPPHNPTAVFVETEIQRLRSVWVEDPRTGGSTMSAQNSIAAGEKNGGEQRGKKTTLLAKIEMRRGLERLDATKKARCSNEYSATERTSCKHDGPHVHQECDSARRAFILCAFFAFLPKHHLGRNSVKQPPVECDVLADRLHHSPRTLRRVTRHTTTRQAHQISDCREHKLCKHSKKEQEKNKKRREENEIACCLDGWQACAFLRVAHHVPMSKNNFLLGWSPSCCVYNNTAV